MNDSKDNAATKVAVQLLTWNGAIYLENCLSSLCAQTYGDWQLFILDNNSEDETPQLIQQWLRAHAGSYQELSQNVGFARGHNLLFQKHKSPYVLVLNQDVWLEPNYLSELVTALDSRPEIGSASGCLLRLDIESDRKGAGFIKTDIMDSAGLKIYQTHRVVERGRGELASRGHLSENVFGVPATAALYRRSALDEAALQRFIGPEWFDEDFGSYKEDVDLAYRLQLLGWSSLYVPTARAYHHRGLRGAVDAQAAFATITTWRHRRHKSVAAKARSYRNHLLFLFKSFAFRVFSPAWWVTVLYESLKLITMVFSEPRTLYVLPETFRLYGKMKIKRQLIRRKNFHPENIQRWF